MSLPTRPGIARGPRPRAVLLVAIALATLVAGCRGGRRDKAAPPATPVVPAPAADSLKPQVPDAAPPVVVAPPDSQPPVVPPDSATPVPVPVTPPAAPAKPAPKPAPTSRPCVLDMTESPPETRLLYNRISETVSNTYVGGGFVGRCQGENNRLRADSAEQFQAAGIVNLYGNVVYEEPDKVQITATHATYFTREGRLYADGNVVATELANGSTFSGPSIEYFRVTPERPVSRMVAPSRSTATLYDRDSTGRLTAPTYVVANRFEDTGDSVLMAWGDVQIDREQISARSDSAAFDKRSEVSRLIRTARIVNRDTTQRFTLVGDTIDMYSTARKLDRIVARHEATATSEDLVLNSEIIDVRLKAQQLEEAFAFGQGRAKATTPQQDVVADSLRIRLVAKQVREVRAVGDAVAIGTPDTLKMRTTDKDLLRGDSIFAFFDSATVAVEGAAPPAAAASRDSAQSPRVKEIRALGNASSLFHIGSSKGKDAPPAINYVRGVRIYVNFDTGTVSDVRVDSAASGVYLEPAPDSLSDTVPRRPAGGRGQRGGAPPGRSSTGGQSPPPRRPPLEDTDFRPLALSAASVAPRRRQ